MPAAGRRAAVAVELARPFEPWTEADNLANEARIDALLEDGPGALDRVAETGRSPALCYPVAESCEVIGAKILDQTPLAKLAHEQVGRFLVLGTCSGRQLARGQQGVFRVQLGVS